MAHFNLIAVTGGGLQSRYFANGKRISAGEYDRITNRAFCDPLGKLDCFRTKAKPLPGGKFRRTNYSTARW